MPERSHHFLCADIGGTHCRFAHFASTDSNEPVLRETWNGHTARFANFRDLIIAARDSLPAEYDAAVLAVPGAIVNVQAVTCPNIPWPIGSGIPELPPAAFLLNDLEAQAWGCLLPSKQNLLPLFSAENSSRQPRDATVRAVLGAGTGLGCCLLIGNGMSYRTLPSELGHASLPIDDADYANYLRSRGIRSDGEHLLSGRGLSTLVEFYTGQTMPPDKAAACLPGTEMETRYAHLLGMLCQTLALSSLCLEGLYLCGGVLTANPSLALHSEFRRSFCNCPNFETLLQTIPINLVQNSNAGLWGAALFAQKQTSAQ